MPAPPPMKQPPHGASCSAMAPPPSRDPRERKGTPYPKVKTVRQTLSIAALLFMLIMVDKDDGCGRLPGVVKRNHGYCLFLFLFFTRASSAVKFPLLFVICYHTDTVHYAFLDRLMLFFCIYRNQVKYELLLLFLPGVVVYSSYLEVILYANSDDDGGGRSNTGGGCGPVFYTLIK